MENFKKYEDQATAEVINAGECVRNEICYKVRSRLLGDFVY